MVKKNFDDSIVDLNRRYQELFYSKPVQKYLKREKYKEYVKEGNYKQIIEDILFKLFVRIPSSLQSNINVTHKSKLKNNSLNDKKIAVYSCIVGNYDKIVEPFFIEPQVEYFMFTDLEVPKNSKWQKVDIKQFDEYKTMTPLQLNRKIKMLPYNYLKDYDYSIYVDGLIEVVAPMTPLIMEMGTVGFGVHYHNQRDCIYDEAVMIKYLKKADMSIVIKQLNQYRQEGFPAHFGLFENTILMRDHRNKQIKQLMTLWWEEYLKYPTRDQLSLPYLIWKTGIKKEQIYIMGNDLNLNPRFNRGRSHNRG